MTWENADEHGARLATHIFCLVVRCSAAAY